MKLIESKIFSSVVLLVVFFLFSCEVAQEEDESLLFEQVDRGTISGLESGCIVLEDIDNDQDLDLIISGNDGNYGPDLISGIIEIYENDGFGFYARNPVSFPTVRNAEIVLDDFNNDDLPDLLITGDRQINPSTTNGETLLFYNNGNGSFTDSGTVIDFTGFDSIDSGDLDGDGDIDFIGSGGDNSQVGDFDSVKIFINDGEGNFVIELLQMRSADGNDLLSFNNSSLRLADIDQDNILDLVIIGDGYVNSFHNNYAKVYKNDGNGSFNEVENSTLIGVQDGKIVLGDLDNDGDIDLIIAGNDESHMDGITNIYANNGSGVFSEIFPESLPGMKDESMALGDIDNDSDLDFIIVDLDEYSFFRPKIFINNGEGFFSEKNSMGLQFMTDTAIALGDIDSDSDLDMIMSGGSIVNDTATGITIIYENTTE